MCVCVCVCVWLVLTETRQSARERGSELGEGEGGGGGGGGGNNEVLGGRDKRQSPLLLCWSHIWLRRARERRKREEGGERKVSRAR